VKVLVIAYSARAMLALHQSRMEEAFVYLRSCDAAAQLIAKNPLELDQLVSYACVSIAAWACWEALQAEGWTDDHLAQLQHQWDGPDFLAAAEASLAMERTRAPMYFQMSRASRQGLDILMGGNSGIKNNAEIWQDLLTAPGLGASELLDSYPRYWGWKWIWSYRDEHLYLEFMQSMIDALRDAQRRSAVLDWPSIRIGTNSLEDQQATAKLDVVEAMKDGTKRFVLHAWRAQTEEGIVRTAIALERYRLKHHAYPTSLRDLLPVLLQQVPIDCMDGRDLRYRLNPDGTYLLYSVGEDGVDNGGDATPVEGRKPGFLSGRDWVWPRAATDEEVQAYEAEQTKPKAAGKK
jgi:hypothetical protein